MVETIIDAAQQYAHRDWKVFTLHTMGNCFCCRNNAKCTDEAKHPWIIKWQNNCSSDPSEIDNWWNNWSDADILATGRVSGFFGTNIDPRQGETVFYEHMANYFAYCAQYVWSKDLRIEVAPDSAIEFFTTTEYSHPKYLSGLQINHYPRTDLGKSKKQRTYLIGANNTSSNLQPERDESSIFDSAWATLKE
jgi:hypothetical protein